MKRRSVFIITGLGLLLVLVGLFASVDFYADYLFFTETNYREVFFKELTTKGFLALVGGLVTTVLYLLNIILANRLQMPWSRFYVIDKNLYGMRRFNLDPILKKISLYLCGPVFLVSGVYWARYWKEYLLFSSAQTYGLRDPIFGRDVSFYMFRLSFVNILLDIFLVTYILIFLFLCLYYVLRGGMAFVERLFSIHRPVKVHLGVLLSLIIVLITTKLYTGRFGLLFSDHRVLYGASYTDVHARLPVMNIMVVLGIATSVGVLVMTNVRKPALVLLPVGVFIILYIVGLGVYPVLLQNFKVTPNELELERPFIENHIRFTREGFGLERIKTRPFEPEGSLRPEDIEANLPTIRNIRLWDEEPLLKTYSQLQQIRTYYRFVDLDNDRYIINGRYRQVMLSPRELSYEDLPQKSWINERLVYTHGIGLAMGPVSGITREGLPEFYIKDIPPVSTVGLRVTRPEIYYGESTNEYVIANTKVKEFGYPTKEGNVYTHYEGKGGVPLDSLLKRLLYSVKFGSIKILLSSDITRKSRIIYYRNIIERARRLAPFLTYDPDPYMVVSPEGNLYWVLDGYSYSDRMPYSRPYHGGFNYLRNPVKVLIDAYNGTVRFYVVDPEDIIVRTYRKVYPTLFKDASEMPEFLRAHIRYPRTLMKVQAEVFSLFHMTDPRVFYNREDQWEIPTYRGRHMEPYYVILRLPGQDREEFVLLMAFTPAKRDNLAAWMAARSDPPHYGEVIVYTFPRDRLVFGPRQIEARIDQDAYISQQLTLWGQRGSDVIRGSLLIVPVKRTLLYVQPLYLVATQRVGLPELRRVIVAQADRVIMRQTLEEAIEALFGTVPVRREPPPQNQVLPQTDPVRQALEYLEKAREALRQEDWQGFGHFLKEAERTLRKAAGQSH